jgi:hypothetical protein
MRSSKNRVLRLKVGPYLRDPGQRNLDIRRVLLDLHGTAAPAPLGVVVVQHAWPVPGADVVSAIVGSTVARQHRLAIDILIAQERKLLELYGARAANAQALGAGIGHRATVAVLLTVTVANSPRHIPRVLAAVTVRNSTP